MVNFSVQKNLYSPYYNGLLVPKYWVTENPLFLESVTMNINPHTKPIVLEDLKSHVVGQ